MRHTHTQPPDAISLTFDTVGSSQLAIAVGDVIPLFFVFVFVFNLNKKAIPQKERPHMP